MQKYKIKLSFRTFHSLIDDMYLFNFFKPNGMINQNKFFLSVIQGYYNNLNFRRELTSKLLLEKLSDRIDNAKYIKDLADEINTKLNEFHHSDRLFKYHPYDIHIQTTKNTEELFEIINLNELKIETMSEFLRNLFNEYISMPIYERERCLFFDIWEKLNEYSSKHKKVLIKTQNNKMLYFNVYGIFTSKEESFNYVVGQAITEKNSTFFTSIKLSNIVSILPTNEYFTFSNIEISKLDKQLEEGPEFICDDTYHAIIKISDIGKAMFKRMYKDRPMPTNIDSNSNEFIFDTKLDKLFFYFLQFGKEIKIIEGKELKEKLETFHKEAISNNLV